MIDVVCSANLAALNPKHRGGGDPTRYFCRRHRRPSAFFHHHKPLHFCSFHFYVDWVSHAVCVCHYYYYYYYYYYYSPTTTTATLLLPGFAASAGDRYPAPQLLWA